MTTATTPASGEAHVGGFADHRGEGRLSGRGRDRRLHGFAESLLRREFTGTQTEGASFAIADCEDILVAVYHWLPTEITTDGFEQVMSRFVGAALALRSEVAAAGAPSFPFAAG